MSLRSEIRRMLEEGYDEKHIVAELRCHPATVEKVLDQVVFEKTIVTDKERERRARVAALSLWDLQVLAKAAGIDPVTLRRVLMGLKVRPSSRALARRALVRLSRADLLPGSKSTRRKGLN